MNQQHHHHLLLLFFTSSTAKVCHAALLWLLLSFHAAAQDKWPYDRLLVSDNGHYLQHADGTPFFWLGDTAWELFHRLDREEISQYLENRESKGFNVIQAVVLAEMDGLRVPNRYGDLPVENLNPERPNEAYFKLVDWVLKQAQQKGLYVGLLPTWGDKVIRLWGEGPEVFNEKNAYQYGYFLGERYKNFPNVIWMVGGDRPAFTDTVDHRPVWRAMVKGIREGAGDGALITYHPSGETSSTAFWVDEDLLDFHTLQSGHRKQDMPVWEWIERDFNPLPAKPILDAEPNYEDHAIDFNAENGYHNDYDVRKQTYRSVFAGGAGVTYGNHSIWQFYQPGVKPITDVERYWNEALDRLGATQMIHLKNLVLSRPALTRVPDQDIIQEGQGQGGEYITAYRDEAGTYAMLYLPVGKQVVVETSWSNADVLTGWWFNPRNGETQRLGMLPKGSQLTLKAPTLGFGNDWVLVLDDAGKYQTAPGNTE